jgi:hypothetical protein
MPPCWALPTSFSYRLHLPNLRTPFLALLLFYHHPVPEYRPPLRNSNRLSIHLHQVLSTGNQTENDSRFSISGVYLSNFRPHPRSILLSIITQCNETNKIMVTTILLVQSCITTSTKGIKEKESLRNLGAFTPRYLHRPLFHPGGLHLPDLRPHFSILLLFHHHSGLGHRPSLLPFLHLRQVLGFLDSLHLRRLLHDLDLGVELFGLRIWK